MEPSHVYLTGMTSPDVKLFDVSVKGILLADELLVLVMLDASDKLELLELEELTEDTVAEDEGLLAGTGGLLVLWAPPPPHPTKKVISTIERK